jgi:NADH pyrophosphatase NudC (nudix superfamily)
MKEVVYFLAFTTSADVKAREGEIAEVEWIPLEEAEHSLTHENDKTVFRAAMERMKKMSVTIK